ncbi:MAG: hypothetical protein ACKN9V_07765 [Pseudomonadota bacterium]
MIKILFAPLFLVSLALAGGVEIPFQQEISNTSSGFTAQEAAAKVRYYLRKELEDWQGLCEVGQGTFRSEFSKTQCEEYYTECWECTGRATAYCD